jgi:hypothetical protein
VAGPDRRCRPTADTRSADQDGLVWPKEDWRLFANHPLKRLFAFAPYTAQPDPEWCEERLSLRHQRQTMQPVIIRRKGGNHLVAQLIQDETRSISA